MLVLQEQTRPLLVQMRPLLERKLAQQQALQQQAQQPREQEFQQACCKQPRQRQR